MFFPVLFSPKLCKLFVLIYHCDDQRAPTSRVFSSRIYRDTTYMFYFFLAYTAHVKHIILLISEKHHNHHHHQHHAKHILNPAENHIL